MSLKAVFVGINEYADLNIDNLEGARFDAVALNALFVDSVPDVKALLLIDKQATKACVETALGEVLDSAQADDVVIVTFSGHGSADAGLVLHDSIVSDPTTMLSLENVAARFRCTRAGRVLVLLDCCESGEGPRRVIKAWAVTDGIDEALHSSAGGGRTMLAAANPLQSALEASTMLGHGLLTASLMHVLTTADSAVDIRVLSAAIAERVRAEAARLGETQTPIDVSVIAGSFSLPALRPGDAFRQAFPDRSSNATADRFSDLEAFGIPASVVVIWETAYPTGLNELQRLAVNRERLLDGKNLLVVAPTGSGKTLLGEMAAIRAVASGRRAVFLVPMRALAAEKHDEFLVRYGNSLALRIIRCTGDYMDSVAEFLHGKYDIALLTYEMFLSLMLARPSALAHVGAVVIDEAHFITDPDRGITVELLMTLLLAARERGATPQLIALSAVIGKINHFDEWLGAGCLQHITRPVPLIEGVIDHSGVFQYVDTDEVEKCEQLVHGVYQRKKEPGAQDVIVPLVRQLLEDANETVLVFRGVKGRAAGAANYIAEALSLAPAANALSELPSVPSSSDSERLRRCLERGTAFHSSDLVREERAAVERAFRDAREVRALASTTTLAAGVNTPATTVIIVEHQFPGDPPRDFTVAEYKNMAGRAGRPGFAPVGRSMLYAATGMEREHLFRRYVRGAPEGVHSSFDPRRIDTWVIRLLRQVGRIEEDRIVSLLANTFGGYTLARLDPSWQGRTERELQGLLNRMKASGLVEEYRERISLTRLGEACGQAALSLESCMLFVEMLRRHGLVSATEMMVLLQCLDEADVYTPLARPNKKGTDRGWSYELAGYVRRECLAELARGAGDDGYEKRCKRSLVLMDWVAGLSMAEIERRFTPNPYAGAVSLGTVRSFSEGTRFFLRSAFDIAKVVFDSDKFPEDSAQILLKGLELGLPESLFDLGTTARLLTREEIIALANSGLNTVDAVASATDAALEAALADANRVSVLRSSIPATATRRL